MVACSVHAVCAFSIPDIRHFFNKRFIASFNSAILVLVIEVDIIKILIAKRNIFNDCVFLALTLHTIYSKSIIFLSCWKNSMSRQSLNFWLVLLLLGNSWFRQLLTAESLPTSWGGISMTEVLRSIQLYISIQGRTKKIPAIAKFTIMQFVSCCCIVSILYVTQFISYLRYKYIVLQKTKWQPLTRTPGAAWKKTTQPEYDSSLVLLYNLKQTKNLGKEIKKNGIMNGLTVN